MYSRDLIGLRFLTIYLVLVLGFSSNLMARLFYWWDLLGFSTGRILGCSCDLIGCDPSSAEQVESSQLERVRPWRAETKVNDL